MSLNYPKQSQYSRWLRSNNGRHWINRTVLDRLHLASHSLEKMVLRCCGWTKEVRQGVWDDSNDILGEIIGCAIVICQVKLVAPVTPFDSKNRLRKLRILGCCTGSCPTEPVVLRVQGGDRRGVARIQRCFS